MERGQPCDILLLVILPDEWKAFLSIFPEAAAVQERSTFKQYSMASFKIGHYSIVAVVLNPDDDTEKDQGPTAAARFATNVLHHFLPRVLVNVGIACRVNKLKTDLCDVVIATSLKDSFTDGGISGLDLSLSSSGLSDIPCNWDLARAVKERSRDSRWVDACAKEVSALGLTPSQSISRSGVVASGYAVNWSDDLLTLLLKLQRRTLAYDMEAHAIAYTSERSDRRPRPDLLVLKGLSDDGTGKDDYQKQTAGSVRRTAARNAFSLFRLALDGDCFRETTGTPPSRRDVDTSAGVKQATVFPYFTTADVREHSVLLDILTNGTNERLRFLREAVQHSHVPLLTAHASDEEVLSWLNAAVDSSFHQHAAGLVSDTYRLRKICRQASGPPNGPREHSEQVINRLLIEHCLNASGGQDVLIRTPIVTCLVENTSHHFALENFKIGFQTKHKVVIDFDAVPLEQLYSASIRELIIDESNRYDLIFHYHLDMRPFFLSDTVAALDNEALTSLKQLIIRQVADECCYTLDRQGHTRAAAIPVNANSVLLVVNDTLFDKHRNAFAKYVSGRHSLTSPTDWHHFESILSFFKSLKQKSDPLYGIVPQGKREGDYLYFEWCNIAYSFAGGVFRRNHGWEAPRSQDVILDSKETIKATRFYRRFYDHSPPDAHNLSTSDQVARFLMGDVAMALVWSDSLHGLFEHAGAKNLKVSAHPIPGDVSMIGGGICCVNINALYPDYARKFVDELLNLETQASLAASGWCSGFESVYDRADVRKLPYADAVKTSLARSKYMIEAGPRSATIRSMIGETIEMIVTGVVEAETILKETAALLREDFG